MDSIRVSAKTVEDALTEASIELGTSSDNIEYTVIDEGSKGFFGIGGRKAVIEAKRKVSEEELLKEIFEEKTEKSKKNLKKDFRKESGKNSEKSEKKEKKEQKVQKEQASESVKEPAKDVVKEVRKETKKEAKKEFKAEQKEQKAQKAAASSVQKKQEHPQPGQAEEKRQDSGKKNFVIKEEEIPQAAAEIEKEPVSEVPKTPVDPEEAKSRAITFIKEILRAMDLEEDVTAEFEEDVLCVNIEGENMGIMIGKRGQTLDSLQYLTSLVVNKGKSSYVRVKVDTEDYRNRRKATLENLARNIASKAKNTGKPVFLEPMNPYERRIIHSALQNDPYVTTHSEGEEPYRKVVVTPKRDRERDYEKGRGYSRYNNRRGRYNRDKYERGNYKRDNRGNYGGREASVEEEQTEFARTLSQENETEE